MQNTEKLKQLRGETGISMIECKKALDEAEGDIKKAKEILREKGQDMIKGKKNDLASSGIVFSYIHPGAKIGVLLKLNCETSFGAKSKEFGELAKEIALQITAGRPLFVAPTEISDEFLDGERKIYKKQFADTGKPAEIIDKIIEGKLNKYKEESSLLTQKWVKDQNKTIQEMIDSYIAKIGENIQVGKFARFEI